MDQSKWHGYGKTIRRIAGFLLLVLGVLGLFLPILPGIVFLLLAAALFGRDSIIGRWLHDRIHWFVEKAKKLSKKE